MNNYAEIFERLDLQHIREFILHGVDCLKVSNKSYKEQIEEVEEEAFAFFEQKFPDIKECEEATDTLLNCTNATQNVYMEIGLQCGAILAMKLLANP